MLKQFWSRIKISHLHALHEQKGQSLIIFTFALLGLIGMLGLALDLGLVYIEQVKVGRTVDAATLAGVVELPFEEDAMRRTIEFIELNGYKPGVDTEILVRGCVDTLLTPYGSGNVSELGANSPITTTNIVTGAILSQYVTAEPPKATFMIDTLSNQPEEGGCDLSDPDPQKRSYGNANKLRVVGKVNVHMNFMQFFGFRDVPVQDLAVAENITNLDVVVVFDISGSMEMETTCYDCWVREDSNNYEYPNNGYFNPLPYNPLWADRNVPDGTPDVQMSIPNSDLCQAAPVPIIDGSNRYLVHEAELYSREVGDWSLAARTTGQGFWVLQRGSNNENNSLNSYENSYYQGNRAGVEADQSSNVCNPGIEGSGINCSPPRENGTPDNVCSSLDGGLARDCSAYIKAHPFPTYGQAETDNPKLQGAAYDRTCFNPLNDPTSACWTSNAINDPTRPTQGGVPYVEYDYTVPSVSGWTTPTYIWVRALGGGDRSNAWNGVAPNTLDESFYNTVFWQVDGGAVTEDSQAGNAGTGWRDSRVVSTNWKWIRLGSVSTTVDQQRILRIYQGSAGYKIDKIVFTNYSGSSVPAFLSQNGGKGPKATNGSATRESCNRCNPAFGLTVGQADCSCRKNSAEAAPGTGAGCTQVLTTTNQLTNDLYRGLEPIRSAQEAVKNFIKRLDPQFDQVGIVAFTGDVKNGTTTYPRRSKLQCLTENKGDPGACWDDSSGTPITFTKVLEAVERQWPEWGTDIAEGMREGLEELGVGDGVNSLCTPGIDNKSACDRQGAARKVLILMTDGAPNNNPGNCAPGGGRGDFWNGDVGKEDADFECAVYFAKEAAENGVLVYTIGIGSGVDTDLLTAMAEGRDPHSKTGEGEEFLFDARGGQFFNAAKPSDLDAIFSRILGNIYVRIVG